METVKVWLKQAKDAVFVYPKGVAVIAVVLAVVVFFAAK